MWTEVVIYLSASHIQNPQRVFDGNRSMPVLPHLGRSDVLPPCLQRVRLKPLCGSSINLPLPPPQHGALMPLHAELHFIRKHQHCWWNVASVCKSWHTVCDSGKPNWEENEPQGWREAFAVDCAWNNTFLDALGVDSHLIPSKFHQDSLKQKVCGEILHIHIYVDDIFWGFQREHIRCSGMSWNDIFKKESD